jgi:hypothetical protein
VREESVENVSEDPLNLEGMDTGTAGLLAERASPTVMRWRIWR